MYTILYNGVTLKFITKGVGCYHLVKVILQIQRDTIFL